MTIYMNGSPAKRSSQIPNFVYCKCSFLSIEGRRKKPEHKKSGTETKKSSVPQK